MDRKLGKKPWCDGGGCFWDIERGLVDVVEALDAKVQVARGLGNRKRGAKNWMQERFSAAAPRDLQPEAVVNAGIWRSNTWKRWFGRFFYCSRCRTSLDNFLATGVSVNPDDESRVEGIAWFGPRNGRWSCLLRSARLRQGKRH